MRRWCDASGDPVHESVEALNDKTTSSHRRTSHPHIPVLPLNLTSAMGLVRPEENLPGNLASMTTVYETVTTSPITPIESTVVEPGLRLPYQEFQQNLILGPSVSSIINQWPPQQFESPVSTFSVKRAF